jgi:phage terminase large subunit
MGFEVTTAVKKMYKMTARKKVIQGSTSSGKTYGIIPILYDKALETERLKITITAETLPALKDGAIDIFKRFMMDEGRWADERWNATDNVYTCYNGSKLQFKSFDSVGRAKAAGKRDILFINEANHVAWDIADALMIRSKEVWLDFNADEEFWAHTEVLKSPDSEFVKLTYLDNEAIPPETLKDLMERKRKSELEEAQGIKGYWWNWWQVYGLGEIGQRQELIYPIFEVLKERPEHFQKYVYGLDFGYQHPMAMVKIWYCEDELFIEEVIYKTLVSDVVNELNKHSIERNVEIVADSARPDLISEIRKAGYYVVKANKAVEQGIDIVRKLKVYVSESALNVIAENKNYKYKRINGVLSETVEKKNDDAMDAIRYATEFIYKNYINYTPLMTY